MTETVGIFENLSVTIKTCDDFTNTSILKWFEVMGSSVKSLSLTCSLNCPHQNKFVEKILKEWCPKLESFALRGVECFECLFQNSFFAEPALENQCRSLKEFIFFFDGLGRNQWSQLCGFRIEDLEGPGDQKLPTVAARMQIHEMRWEFVDNLVDYVDLAVEPWYGLSLAEQLRKLVTRPIGLSSLEGMTPRTFGIHVPAFFQRKFSCDPGYEHDGGILGQLMKMSKVEKLVIHNANQKWFFNELFAIFYYRPNLWRSSLTHFESFGRSPPVTTQKMISRVGLALKTLNFVGGFWLDSRFDPKSVERILRNCSETLEELEFGVGAFKRQLILPTLPKLKTLVVESNGDLDVRLTCQDVLKKLPKLERCVVRRNGKGGSSANFFGGGDKPWRDLGSYSHPLKELKLLDECVDERGIGRIVRGLPNLKKLELSIRKESGEDFKAFWEKMGELPLEQVKVSFSVKSESRQAYDLYEIAIIDNVKEFKDIRSLELVNKAKQPFPLTSRLSKGLSEAIKLRVLKFTNFEVGIDERKQIQKSLAHVAFQLPALKSSGRRLRSEKKT